MRISFDLDDTLICYDEGIAREPRMRFLARMIIRDEPLRLGTRELVDELHRRGHDVWIYTSSVRSLRWIRWWMRFHGVRIGGVVNGVKHAKCFGERSLPSKRPHVFGIHLHVDNSVGVAEEGRRYGFNVCVIEPCAPEWVQQVLDAMAASERWDSTPAH